MELLLCGCIESLTAVNLIVAEKVLLSSIPCFICMKMCEEEGDDFICSYFIEDKHGICLTVNQKRY
jgi:hypothetical protein